MANWFIVFVILMIALYYIGFIPKLDDRALFAWTIFTGVASWPISWVFFNYILASSFISRLLGIYVLGLGGFAAIIVIILFVMYLLVKFLGWMVGVRN